MPAVSAASQSRVLWPALFGCLDKQFLNPGRQVMRVIAIVIDINALRWVVRVDLMGNVRFSRGTKDGFDLSASHLKGQSRRQIPRVSSASFDTFRVQLYSDKYVSLE